MSDDDSDDGTKKTTDENDKDDNDDKDDSSDADDFQKTKKRSRGGKRKKRSRDKGSGSSRSRRRRTTDQEEEELSDEPPEVEAWRGLSWTTLRKVAMGLVGQDRCILWPGFRKMKCIDGSYRFPGVDEQGVMVLNNFFIYNLAAVVGKVDRGMAKVKRTCAIVKKQEVKETKGKIAWDAYYHYVQDCKSKIAWIYKTAAGYEMPGRKRKYWGEVMLESGLRNLVSLFPKPVEIVKELLLQQNQEEGREKFPTKQQVKSAVDTRYKAMKEHYMFCRLLIPKTEGNPPFKDINLRCYPEVYARVFGIVAFVTSGNDAKIQHKSINDFRTHGDVGR